jgi:hypothetical protein
MLLGENPVSENGRFVHQMATLTHANDQHAHLIQGSSDIKGSFSDIKGSSSTATPLGKRFRTSGERVDLSLNIPLDSATEQVLIKYEVRAVCIYCTIIAEQKSDCLCVAKRMV